MWARSTLRGLHVCVLGVACSVLNVESTMAHQASKRMRTRCAAGEGSKCTQWSKLGMREPLPSQALQPMVHPCENQKHCTPKDACHGPLSRLTSDSTQSLDGKGAAHTDWPLLHSEVPLVHLQLYGSIHPVLGCLPLLHAAVSASIELREGGMIIEA